MNKPYCYSTLDQVRDSHLLSPERMAAIEVEIESRISPVCDKDGRVITTGAIARFSYGSFVYPRLDHDPSQCYMRRELLADILTPDELKLVNDCACSAASTARDAARFEKAVKLDSWDGWVTDGDGYWDSVESYLDEKGDEIENGAEETVPLYLWVAIPQQVIPSLDVADVTEHWVSDRGWENMDTDDLEGVKELQAALDAFVEANRTVVSYVPDYGRVVMLNGYLTAGKADAEYDRIASL